MWTDADVRRYLWDDVVISRERAEETVREVVRSFERTGRGLWLIHEQTASASCGFCGFLPREDQRPAELIYGLLRRVWGRGYATESVRAVMDRAFTALGVPKIVAAADVPNEASVRVMERAGMCRVRSETVNGLPLVFYEIDAAGWLARRATAPPDTAPR
jgi:ribosomal-protein-alanine N-acetyltransferase